MSKNCQRYKTYIHYLYDSVFKHYELLSLNDVFLFEPDNPLIIKLSTLNQQYSQLAGRDEEMFLYIQQEEQTNGSALTTSTTSTSAKPVAKKIYFASQSNYDNAWSKQTKKVNASSFA